MKMKECDERFRLENRTLISKYKVEGFGLKPMSSSGFTHQKNRLARRCMRYRQAMTTSQF